MGNDVLGSLSVEPTASPRKGIVIVHGGGIWKRDYWKPIVTAIQECASGVSTAPSFGAVGVCYSDVMNSQDAKTVRAAMLAPQRNVFMNVLMWDNILASVAAVSHDQLLQKISASLLGALRLGIAKRSGEAILDAFAWAFRGKSLNQLSIQIARTDLPGGMNVAATIQDVCLYLFDDTFAQRIRQELIDGLRDAQQYDEIVLVSHSLGAVVAFDVLNEWAESKPKISHWFTLGCPLTKVLFLRKNTPDRLKHANVKHWYNIYDSSDIVASALGPKFTKPGYSIHDIFVDVCVSLDPIKSHDYFNNPTALKLIADALG